MKKHALLVKIVIWDLHAKVRSPHSCRNVHFAFKSAKKKKMSQIQKYLLIR